MNEIAVAMLIIGFVWLGIITKARVFYLGSVGMLLYLALSVGELFVIIPVIGMAAILVFMTFWGQDNG